MSTKDLDFLLDEKANRIGALLLHLVAVEKFYQANTFDGMNPDKLPEAWKEKWGPAMELGEPGRKQIQGNTLDYYLNNLNETREKTLAEFRKRDDAWLNGGGQNLGLGTDEQLLQVVSRDRARSQSQRANQVVEEPHAGGEASLGVIWQTAEEHGE